MATAEYIQKLLQDISRVSEQQFITFIVEFCPEITPAVIQGLLRNENLRMRAEELAMFHMGNQLIAKERHDFLLHADDFHYLLVCYILKKEYNEAIPDFDITVSFVRRLADILSNTYIHHEDALFQDLRDYLVSLTDGDIDTIIRSIFADDAEQLALLTRSEKIIHIVDEIDLWVNDFFHPDGKRPLKKADLLEVLEYCQQFL